MSDKERSPNKLSISILICFNIVFALCGATVLTLGVLILWDVGRQLLFRLVSPGSSILGQVGISLLGIGSFGFLTAILGCTTAARKCSVGWYILCVCLVLIAEIGLGISFLFFHNSLGKNLEGTELISKLHASYGINQPFTQAMDFAQHKFNCCGVDGDVDYDRSTWRNSKLGGSELIVPRTCCPLDEAVSDSPAYMNPVPLNVTACQTTKLKKNRYIEGCKRPVEVWLRNETVTFIVAGLMLFLLQIFSLAAAICLCRKVR